MKIAYAKFGGAITYGSDELLGTAGGVNMVSRYIQQLLELGHEVFPIVPLTRKSAPWPGSKEQDIENADAVIIDNGANSLLASYKGVPAITYLLSKLACFSGPVIYLQSDPDLPFTFFPENFTPTHYHGPSSYELQLEHKRWYIVTSCRDLGQFQDGVNNGRRYGYQLVDPDNVSFHTVELHDVLADPNIKPAGPASIDRAAYVGGDRRCNSKLVEYSRAIDLDLYGKWKDESVKRLGSRFNYKGILGDGEVTSLYSEYTHSLIMGSPRYERVGMVAARFWETTFAGCLPLLDSALVDPLDGLTPVITPGSVAATLAPFRTRQEKRDYAMMLREWLLERNANLGPVMARVLELIK